MFDVGKRCDTHVFHYNLSNRNITVYFGCLNVYLHVSLWGRQICGFVGSLQAKLLTLVFPLVVPWAVGDAN